MVGEHIARYAVCLEEQGYARASVYERVLWLLRFGEFAQAHGARSTEALPRLVAGFPGAHAQVSHKLGWPERRAECSPWHCRRSPFALEVVIFHFSERLPGSSISFERSEACVPARSPAMPIT